MKRVESEMTTEAETTQQDIPAREHILEAALAVIAEHKISGIRMRQIAEEAGISPGTLHHYFSTKSDLLLALLDTMQQAFDDDRQRLFSESPIDSPRKLRVFPLNQRRILVHHPRLEEVFFDFWSQGMIDPDVRLRIRRMYADWREDIRAVIDEGLAEGTFAAEDPELVVLVMISLMEGLALQYLLEPDLIDLDVYFETAHRIALDLLGVPSRPTYPTDLTDDEWEAIADLLPAARPGGRPRHTNLREVVNALLYVAHCGCSWRMLPHDFPSWQTVYGYYSSWAKSDVLAQVEATLNRNISPGSSDLPAAQDE
jgi:AcrR family transcriptional regulator